MVNLFWHRRDLRIQDNAGLYHALKDSHPVLPLFIFDTDILDKLEDKTDARVQFIHEEIQRIHRELKTYGSSILVRVGRPVEVWQQLVEEYDINKVFTNRDYEPYAKERDQKIRNMLEEKDVSWADYKDHVVFDRDEVVKADGDPYVVFTPYSRVWKKKFQARMTRQGDRELSFFFKEYPNQDYVSNYFQCKPIELPSLENLGFSPSAINIPSREVPRKLIRTYDETRNYPAEPGTSRLGIHFRFGTISIREKAHRAQILNETFLNELIWRDFYAQILDHFPHVVEGPFREKYNYIPWRNNEEEFKKWCDGQTGYPIVDAGMRELNATGFMHNRVRMIVASFLTKHLLIDWRWGEAYFASKLLDFDLASNNGGWQWAAGSGTDAAPYFRIFNPHSQTAKFDKQKRYIREWVPEFNTPEYPTPMVDHKMARERCLTAYKSGLARADEEMNS